MWAPKQEYWEVNGGEGARVTGALGGEGRPQSPPCLANCAVNQEQDPIPLWNIELQVVWTSGAEWSSVNR